MTTMVGLTADALRVIANGPLLTWNPGGRP
jgi:hypothetical protein